MSILRESRQSRRAAGSVEIFGPTLLLALGFTAAGCTAAGSAEIYVAGGPSSLGGSSNAGLGGAPPGPDDPPPIFDETPPAPSEPDTCDKVDFLYVVDNSQTMASEQDKLARSFIEFSRIAQETLGSNDYQIMVVDTDARNGNDTLNARGQSDVDPCIGVLGAGLRVGSEGQSCDIDGSQHYMLNQQSEAATAFSCLANVGIFGNGEEQQVAALLAATGASGSSDAEACNTGFLRDDAILVVTIISDEDDDFSPGEPEDWKRALLDLKGGNEDGVVVLGLLSDTNVEGGLPGGPCDVQSGYVPAPRLQAFVESFGERGKLGSICASDYATFFTDALSVIDNSCRQFVPVR